MQTIIYRMEKQQGPTVQHRELYSIPCDKPEWKRTWRRIYRCITESLCCTAKINTTLWTNYTSIKFKKRETITLKNKQVLKVGWGPPVPRPPWNVGTIFMNGWKQRFPNDGPQTPKGQWLIVRVSKSTWRSSCAHRQSKCRVSRAQAELRETAGSVPDQRDKANITIKQVTQSVWFPNTYKSYVYIIL